MYTRSLRLTFSLAIPLLVAAAVSGCTRTGSGISACEEGRTLCGSTCVDTERNPDNCGTCGTSCELGEVCLAGSCAAFCPEGWTPCGPNPTDCADLSSDHANCGQCGASCGAQVCDQGTCADNCSPGTTECDGSCVDTTANPANCGACGVTCSADNAVPTCVAGQCGIESCLPGFLNCNGDILDGCELNGQDDPQNCGGCGIVCAVGPNAVAGCTNGVCTTECAPGFTDCDGDPANGCEADLLQDDLNCGQCGNTCEGRACEQGSCTGDCAAGLQECGTECVDTASDPDNCGSCGFVCNLANATAGCAASQCVINSCTANFDDCDGDPANGCETDLLQDDINCGQCGNVCATGIACGGGECQSPGVLCGGVTCPEPQLCCRSGGGMGGGTTSCFDPSTQVCSGSVLECDGSSDCAAGEVCCREEAVDPNATTCTSTCSDTVLCSQSLDCPAAAPYCCASGGMVTTNACEPDPC